MIVTQNTKLNVVPGGIIPVVHVSQYDVDRAISFTLYDGNGAAVLDNGTTVTIEGTKPDGHGFQYAGTLTGNVASFNTTQQMTVLPGAIECKLTLRKDSQIIGTAMFILDVEKAGINEGTDISDTDIPMIISLATEQMENAEAWAVGTKNGEPVTPTDPQYNNDAKHWAEEAAAAVSGVAGVKGNAEEEYRHGNVNLTPEDLGAVSWQQQNVLGAKNLIPYPFYHETKTQNGVTFTDNGDGTVTVNTIEGGATGYAYYTLNNNYYTKNNENYILSGCPSGGEYGITYCISYYEVTPELEIVDVGEGVTIPGTGEKSRIVICVWQGAVCNNLVFKPMLRLASINDNTFEPYTKTNRELTEDAIECKTFVSNSQVRGLAANSDLNNCYLTGDYYSTSNSITGSLSNKPSDLTKAFRMTVLNSYYGVGGGTTTDAITQIITLINNVTPCLYIRHKPGSGSWGSWYKFSGTEVS